MRDDGRSDWGLLSGEASVVQEQCARSRSGSCRNVPRVGAWGGARRATRGQADLILVAKVVGVPRMMLDAEARLVVDRALRQIVDLHECDAAGVVETGNLHGVGAGQ